MSNHIYLFLVFALCLLCFPMGCDGGDTSSSGETASSNDTNPPEGTESPEGTEGNHDRGIVANRPTLIEHDDTVYCVAFSPDGKTLASGSFNDTITLWDVATGKKKAALIGHVTDDNDAASVAFSPDGKTLA